MRGCVCRQGTFLESHRCRNQGALVARLYPARITVRQPRHALKVQAVASTAEAEKARRRPGEKKGEHRVLWAPTLVEFAICTYASPSQESGCCLKPNFTVDQTCQSPWRAGLRNLVCVCEHLDLQFSSVLCVVGFVEEMRIVAMKLHTKDQAPKEGGKEASPKPMSQVCRQHPCSPLSRQDRLGSTIRQSQSISHLLSSLSD